MKRTNISILIILAIASSAIPFGLFIVAAPTSAKVLPDYEPVYLESGLAGDVYLPEISFEDYLIQSSGPQSSTPVVDTVVEDWYAGPLRLRGLGDYIEVWVAEDLTFPDGDSRNDDPYNTLISDEMVSYLVEQFDNIIYPRCIDYFGMPFDRDGTLTIFELIGWEIELWDWIEATDPANPQRVIVKILKCVDQNYFDPTYPYYVVGFFNSLYTNDYYNRNMVHLDCWRWWQSPAARPRPSSGHRAQPA